MEFFCLHMSRRYPETQKRTLLPTQTGTNRSLRMLSSVYTFIYHFLDIPLNRIYNWQSLRFP